MVCAVLTGATQAASAARTRADDHRLDICVKVHTSVDAAGVHVEVNAGGGASVPLHPQGGNGHANQNGHQDGHQNGQGGQGDHGGKGHGGGDDQGEDGDGDGDGHGHGHHCHPRPTPGGAP
ncbi:hypothetical protein, partial [Kitasatospora sp. NRRL B-11411]|uniref:hypothetical protein n=1 Tax=Kitasatospora sp. NRRL B-11411 TaxID=1463822 RepID=UPI0018E2F749